jgi:hypothetical protein
MKNLPRIDHWAEPVDGEHVAAHAARAWDVERRYSVFMIVSAVAYYYDWQKEYAVRRDLEKRLHDFEWQLYSFYGGKRFVKQWSHDAEDGCPYWGSLRGAIPANN